MISRCCAMPSCSENATGIFCSRHYFQLPSKDVRFLSRMQIMISRADDDGTRQHLREQLTGYIAIAVRKVQNVEATYSSQAASTSARHLSSSRMAGANHHEVRRG